MPHFRHGLSIYTRPTKTGFNKYTDESFYRAFESNEQTLQDSEELLSAREHQRAAKAAWLSHRAFWWDLIDGLIYLTKRVAGYSRAEAMLEWKNDKTLVPFFHHWRGKRLLVMRVISRLDRLLLAPGGWLMDRLGFGFVMTIEAEKVASMREQA